MKCFEAESCQIEDILFDTKELALNLGMPGRTASCFSEFIVCCYAKKQMELLPDEHTTIREVQTNEEAEELLLGIFLEGMRFAEQVGALNQPRSV